jgi:RNA polymerase sigma factor (sigma-70 family)
MKSHDYLDLSMKYNHTALDPFEVNSIRDKFVEGDDNAYSTIYELYAKDLYAFGLSLRAKSEVIEDAIHDVFVEIYTHRQNLAKVDNIKFYFLTAFRNRLFFLLKKDAHTSELTESDTIELQEKDYQEIWIENENSTEKELLLKRLLSGLNQNQREAIYHRYVEGLSCEEIATLMNINYQSAKNLIHRAIKKLKAVAVLTVLLILFSF